jgi:hypothetical protein
LESREITTVRSGRTFVFAPFHGALVQFPYDRQRLFVLFHLFHLLHLFHLFLLFHTFSNARLGRWIRFAFVSTKYEVLRGGTGQKRLQFIPTRVELAFLTGTQTAYRAILFRTGKGLDNQIGISHRNRCARSVLFRTGHVVPAGTWFAFVVITIVRYFPTLFIRTFRTLIYICRFDGYKTTIAVVLIAASAIFRCCWRSVERPVVPTVSTAPTTTLSTIATSTLCLIKPTRRRNGATACSRDTTVEPIPQGVAQRRARHRTGG